MSDIPLPTPDELKTTLDAGQAWWAATQHLIASAAWIGPWVVTFSAAITAASKKVQDIPFIGPLLNILGLNVGAAKNLSTTPAK